MAKKTAPLLPRSAELLRQLGERLRLARLRRRLPARQVSERAGMAPMTLRSIERGGSGVTIGAYVAVMQVLGIEEDLDLVAKADPLGRQLQDARLPSHARQQSKPQVTAQQSNRVTSSGSRRRSAAPPGKRHLTTGRHSDAVEAREPADGASPAPVRETPGGGPSDELRNAAWTSGEKSERKASDVLSQQRLRQALARLPSERLREALSQLPSEQIRKALSYLPAEQMSRTFDALASQHVRKALDTLSSQQLRKTVHDLPSEQVHKALQAVRHSEELREALGGLPFDQVRKTLEPARHSEELRNAIGNLPLDQARNALEAVRQSEEVRKLTESFPSEQVQKAMDLVNSVRTAREQQADVHRMKELLKHNEDIRNWAKNSGFESSQALADLIKVVGPRTKKKA
jgi:transcriptional regulator with XRE-family HTH domain